MAMIVGDAALGTGMAGAMYAGLLAADTALAAAIVAHPPLGTKMQNMCNGMAAGIVNYIHSDARTSTTVAIGGVQQVGGVDTQPPSSTVFLPGVVT